MVPRASRFILGKGQGRSLYNVGDVREITYIGTSLNKGERMRIVHDIQEDETVGRHRREHAKDLCSLGQQAIRVSIPHD
jgi:hypothetical protein